MGFHKMVEWIMGGIRSSKHQAANDDANVIVGFKLSMLLVSIQHWNQSQIIFFVENYWLELKEIALDFFIRSELICSKCLRVIMPKEDRKKLFIASLMYRILNLSFSKIESIRSIPRSIRIEHTKSKWLKKCDFGSTGSLKSLRLQIRGSHKAIIRCGFS